MNILLTNLYRTSGKKLCSTTLLVALMAIFFIGCGNSQDDFVATNSNGFVGADTGNLVFNFTRAQSIEVPATTTTIDFNFFNAVDASVFQDSQAFANTITVQNVPISATRVVITARGQGGIPLATIEAPVTVVGGGTAVVDLSGATITAVTLDAISVSPNPINLDPLGASTAQILISGTFSNGETLPLGGAAGTAAFTGFNAGIATVDASGLASAVSSGTTDVDVDYTLNGVTVSLADVPIVVGTGGGQLIVEPDALQFAPGGLIGGLDDIINLLGGPNGPQNLAFFRAYFIPAGETERREVTSRIGVSFDNIFPSTVGPESFAFFNIQGEGIAITANPLAPQPPFGSTATMTVTYINEGQVFTDTVAVTLDNPTLVGVELGAAPNGSINLPADNVTNFPLVARAQYSNGLKIPIALDGSIGFNGDTFQATIPAVTGFSLNDAAGTISTSGATPGTTATISIQANGTTPVNTFDVNFIDGDPVEVAVTTTTPEVNPDGTYTVTVTYDDTAGTTQNLTNVWNQVGNDGPGDVDLFGLLDGGFPTGRALGTQVGPSSIHIDNNSGVTADVTGFLMGLGFTNGSDTNTANNEVVVNVLSTVPLSIL